MSFKKQLQKKLSEGNYNKEWKKDKDEKQSESGFFGEIAFPLTAPRGSSELLKRLHQETISK